MSLSCPRAVSWDSAVSLPLLFPAHRPLEAVSMACRDASGPQPDIWEPWPAWGRGCSPSGADGAPTHPLPPGLLWQLRPSDVEVELLAHTRQVVSRELEEETGLHTGWIQNGGLFIASSRQRLDEYKRLMSVGAPPPAGVGSVVQGRSPGGCGSSLVLPRLGSAPCDRQLCLRASAFSPLKWDRVEDHGSAEPQRQKRPSGWGLPPRAALPGVRLKDEPAQPGRQGPLFPQLHRRCLGNTVVRETAEEALLRGRPAVGVECWSFTQSSQGWPPHSRAWEGRVSPAMRRLPSTNCILAKQNRLRGKRRRTVAGTPCSSGRHGGSSGSWLPHSRAGDLWGQEAVSFRLLPPPLPHATHSSAGTGHLWGFQLKFGARSLPPLSQDAPRGNLIGSAHL